MRQAEPGQFFDQDGNLFVVRAAKALPSNAVAEAAARALSGTVQGLPKRGAASEALESGACVPGFA